MYSILDANSAQAFYAQESRKVKMAFLANFDQFFGNAVILPLNFTDSFAATATTTYSQKIPINIF